MLNRSLVIGLLTVLFFASASAQQTSEVTLTFNEQFFDALLDALFQNGGPPEIPLSKNKTSNVAIQTAAFRGPCTESIKLLRENQSIRTAVRFRDGKIYMLSETGDTIVLKAGRQPEVLARNALNGRILASPAISGGRLFIRTDDALIAIGRGGA